MSHIIKKTFLDSLITLEKFISDESNLKNIENAGILIIDSLMKGGKIIACGNGGSMSDAMHFAEEMNGKFRNNRKPLPALAISDPAYLSCVANDYGYQYVFSRFVEGMGNPEDVLLGISTSGNSENVVLAAKTAKQKGMRVVGLTGKTGGKLSSLCDVEVRAPETPFADRAQEIHIKVIHALIEFVEEEMNLNTK